MERRNVRLSKHGSSAQQLDCYARQILAVICNHCAFKSEPGDIGFLRKWILDLMNNDIPQSLKIRDGPADIRPTGYPANVG